MESEVPWTRPSTDEDPPRTAERRQRILEHLSRRSDAMSERELAARVAGRDAGSMSNSNEEEVEDIHVVLRHVDLPKIEDAGLVDWNEAEGTVAPVEEEGRSEAEVRQRVADGWDDERAVSRYERRQHALQVLSDATSAVALNDLAAEVAAHEAEAEPAESDVEDVAVALHHRHLPPLERAGLIEYDPGHGAIDYRGDEESEDDARLSAPDRC